MAHWTERLYEVQADTFAEFFERRFEQATEEVQDLLELLAAEWNHDPERILDVACGTGRHVLAFTAEGRHIDGLDFSREFIERARERATEQGVADQVAFHRHDMRALDEWEESYDLITNFWNSLGYYGKETDIGILSAMRELLSEDGFVVVEMSNKEHYVNNYQSSSVSELGDRLHVNRTEFDLTTGRMHSTVEVFSMAGDEYEHLDTMEFQPRIYAPVELKEMCEQAGFEEIALFGGFAGESLTLDAPRVVVVAG